MMYEDHPERRITMLTPSDEILSIPKTLCVIAAGGGEPGHKSSRHRDKPGRGDHKMIDASQQSGACSSDMC
jgi:hypothetical protein